jgi:transposase
MGDLTRAANHLTIEEVKIKMKEAKDPRELRRWQIIYTALIQPRKAEDIAKCVGVSKSLVQKIIPRYHLDGIQAIEIKGCGGRYHNYMSEKEEEILLEPFYQKAEKGELTTAKEIKLAYEEKIGYKVHKTTIYGILKRHGWRKILPRGRHPKADIEAQETFKKTSPKPLKKRRKTENRMMSGQ